MPLTLQKKLLITIGVAIALCCAAFYVGHYLIDMATGGYWHFLKRDQHYYVEFARACDSIMVHYPVGTNLSVRIPVADPSLPKIIRNMHPTRIESQPNRVWMMIGEGRVGYGIAWEPQRDGQPNTWAIDTFAEGLVRTPYVETRP